LLASDYLQEAYPLPLWDEVQSLPRAAQRSEQVEVEEEVVVEVVEGMVGAGGESEQSISRENDYNN